MKKVLSPEQTRQADKFTIVNEPIASIALMERASTAFVAKLLELIPKKAPIYVFCGVGNNGGDGLAVARILREKNHDVRAYVVGNPSNGSKEFTLNWKRLSDSRTIATRGDIPSQVDGVVLIDAMFGVGLTRPLQGIYSEVVSILNEWECERISIDIASGLYADKSTPRGSAIFKPHHTLSFHVPKKSFFLPECEEYTGAFHLVPIGLNDAFINEELASSCFLSEKEDVKHLIPRRKRFTHKNEVGRLMIVAGSKGKMGAAVLCARAAFRSGVGIVNMCVPSCGTEILQVSVPEAMVVEGGMGDYLSSVQKTEDTVVLGPGLGMEEKTRVAVEAFLKKHSRAVVLDADALNMLSAQHELIQHVPQESILTPHPGELRRLLGSWENDFEKLEMISTFCKKHKFNAVLKGAYSLICDSEGILYFNPTGNPSMATAGSGDVLAGMVGSLLAQGLRPIEALKLGVFLHGMAGDVAKEKNGENSTVSSDIIESISQAMRTLNTS